MLSSAMGSVWYLDIGASYHMKVDKEILCNLEEKDLEMHIEMGDDEWYSATRIGTVTFQRQSGKPLISIKICNSCTRSKEKIGLSRNVGG